MKIETINKARVTRLQNKLRREMARSKWTLNGTEFSNFLWLGLYLEHTFGCWFYCNLKRVRAHICGEEAYDLPDADATFTGEEAWSDCIDWVVSKIGEMTDIIFERNDRARPARAEYLRKLKGA